MPAHILGQQDIKENPKVIQGTAEEVNKPDTAYTHTAAFLVLIDKQGNTIFEPDINKAIVPQRQIQPKEVKHAVQDILDDIKAQEAGATMINMQMQMAQQMQERAQNQAILQQMQQGR